MTSLLKNELNKIVDVYNSRIIKFIFKYGIIKAEFIQLIISLLFLLLGSNAGNLKDNFLNIGMRLLFTIIPGIIWGLIDYINYKDVIAEKKKYTIKSSLYIVLYGIFGWGIVCGLSNIMFVPFDSNTLIMGITAAPIYGLIIGLISRKSFNGKLIKQLYEDYIKGKNIKKVQLNKKPIKMNNK